MHAGESEDRAPFHVIFDREITSQSDKDKDLMSLVDHRHRIKLSNQTLLLGTTASPIRSLTVIFQPSRR